MTTTKMSKPTTDTTMIVVFEKLCEVELDWLLEPDEVDEEVGLDPTLAGVVEPASARSSQRELHTVRRKGSYQSG